MSMGIKIERHLLCPIHPLLEMIVIIRFHQLPALLFISAKSIQGTVNVPSMSSATRGASEDTKRKEGRVRRTYKRDKIMHVVHIKTQ